MASSTSPLLQRLESASARPTNFVFVGNPGVGKSTLLNCLLGKVHFRSGVSIGQGMTYQCDMVQIGHNKFLDTPGLADTKLREQAAEAISQALRQGGNYKVFFVIALQNGRVRAEDITTLRLVLKAAPEIGSQYAIVINQLTKGEMRLLTDPDGESMQTLRSSLARGLQGDDDEEEVGSGAQLSDFIMLNHRDEDLEDMTDMIAPISPHLLDFVATAVPIVAVHKEKVDDVEYAQFQALSDKVETVLHALREQNALMAAQLEDKNARLQELEERLASQGPAGSAVHTTDSSSANDLPNKRTGTRTLAILQIAYGPVVGVAGAVASISVGTTAGYLALLPDLLFMALLIVVGSLGCKATAPAASGSVLLELKKKASSYCKANWWALFLGVALLIASWIAELFNTYGSFAVFLWRLAAVSLFLSLQPVAVYFASSYRTWVTAATGDVTAPAVLLGTSEMCQV